MYVLQVGHKYLCADEDGYTFLGDIDNENIMKFETYEKAIECGKKIFDDPHCIKFKVIVDDSTL